jgi:hypothetical protein
VLEDLEDGDDLDGAIAESEASGVHPRGEQTGEPAARDRGQIAHPVDQAIDRHHLERRHGVDERPEEDAAAGADVEQRGGRQRAQRADHAANPRQLGRALEAVELQAGGQAGGDRGLVVEPAPEAAAAEGRGQRDVMGLVGEHAAALYAVRRLQLAAGWHEARDERTRAQARRG